MESTGREYYRIYISTKEFCRFTGNKKPPVTAGGHVKSNCEVFND